MLVARRETLRAGLEAGGRLLALGNGGSATDAMDVVADFRLPARPALDAAARDRPHRGHRDPDGDRQRHRHRGDLLAPGDRARARGRHRARDLDERQLGQRDRRARGGPRAAGCARSRWWATTAAAWRAEGLADHVVVTRSEHIPRIQEAQASAYHVLRELVCVSRVRARVEGTVQGVGLPPLRLPARRRARRGRPRAERLARRGGGGRGGAGDGRPLPRAPGGGGAAARAAWSAWCRSRSRRPARLGFAIRESPRDGEPRAAVSAGQRHLRRLPRRAVRPADRRFRYPFTNCTNCGPRFTIVRGRPLRPARTRRWPASRCARRAGASTRTRPTGASTPSRTRARSAGRELDARRAPGRRRPARCGRLRPRGAARRGDRRRQGARRLPSRLPCRRRGGRRATCVRASTARTSRSR